MGLAHLQHFLEGPPRVRSIDFGDGFRRAFGGNAAADARNRISHEYFFSLLEKGKEFTWDI
jgi:hypothetical protein